MFSIVTHGVSCESVKGACCRGNECDVGVIVRVAAGGASRIFSAIALRTRWFPLLCGLRRCDRCCTHPKSRGKAGDCPVASPFGVDSNMRLTRWCLPCVQGGMSEAAAMVEGEAVSADGVCTREPAGIDPLRVCLTVTEQNDGVLRSGWAFCSATSADSAA